MVGDLHSNKEQLTCFTTRHEEKKLHSGASWDFFCGGVETHIFLTRERAACFPVRACVSDPLSSYCMCVVVKLWLRYLDDVNCNG